MGVTGGGEVLIIPQQGMFLIRIHTERAGVAKPQALTVIGASRKNCHDGAKQSDPTF
jgi:hypothetical protein